MRICLQKDRTASPPITAVGAAAWHVFFSPERHDAVAALAAADRYLRLVDEHDRSAENEADRQQSRSAIQKESLEIAVLGLCAGELCGHDLDRLLIASATRELNDTLGEREQRVVLAHADVGALLCESRPLREEPSPFLWAKRWRLMMNTMTLPRMENAPRCGASVVYQMDSCTVKSASV